MKNIEKSDLKIIDPLAVSNIYLYIHNSTGNNISETIFF